MAQPTLDEFLAQARPLNPDYTDTQIADEYHKAYPGTTAEVAGAPPLDDFIAQAKPLNPGYSDEQIAEQYHLHYGKPAETDSNFVRGAKVGMEQLVPTLQGAVGLLGETAEQATGKGGISTAVKEWGLQGFHEGMKKIAPLQRENDELTTVWKKVTENGDVGALTDFVTYGLGYGASQLAQAAVVGLGGAVVGSAIGGPAGTIPGAVAGVVEQTAARGLMKRWVDAAIAKRVGQGMTQEAAVKSIGRDIGGLAGLGGFATAQEMGQIYPEAVEDGHELSGSELARIWGSSAIAGGSELIPEAYIFGKALGRITGGPSRLGRAAGTAVGGATLEAGQEAFQTAVEHVGAGKPIADEAGLKDIINAAGLAFVGGGSAGAVSGAISPTPKRAEEPAAGELPGATTPPGTPPLVPVQPILGAGSVDDAIIKAKDSVEPPPITMENLDTFIRDAQGGAKIAVDDVTIAAQKSADLDALAKNMNTESPVTKGSDGQRVYKGLPLTIIHSSELPEASADTTQMTSAKYQALSDVASLFGKRIVIYEANTVMPDGLANRHQDPATIFMSNRTTADPFSVMMHESLHLMEGTDFHQVVQHVVWEQKTPGSKQRALKRHGRLSDQGLLNEMIADIAGTEFHKPEMWKKVYTELESRVGEGQAKTQVLAFIDTIKGLITKVTDLIQRQVWMGGAKHKTLAEQYVKDLTKVQDALAKGVAEAIYRTKSPSADVGKIALQNKSGASKSEREIVHPDAVMKFQTLAGLQRGKPEAAMLKVQKLHGGGVLNPVVEHVGDLIHRMTEMSQYGEAQPDNILSKVDRALTALTHPYGFEKEHDENITNNARHHKSPVAEHRAALDAALSAYAGEHRKLPVYNLPQWLAREASVAVGEKRFQDAVTHLTELKTLASGADFGKKAFEYQGDVYHRPVDVKLIGVQRGIPNIPDFALYNLEKDIPGHPAGSTVTEETIRAAGYKPAPTDIISKADAIRHRQSLKETGKDEGVSNKSKDVYNKSEKGLQKPADTSEASKADEEYDYASTQINLPTPLAKKVLEIGKQIETADLAEKGLEDTPHITVKYGLHDEDPKKVKALLASHGPVSATIGDIGMFTTEDGDVIILKVTSDQLVAMNKTITDTLPNTTTYADYKPHITIAYVKTGLGKGYVRTLENPIEGQSISVNEISFSDKAGEQTSVPLGEKKETAPNLSKIVPFTPSQIKSATGNTGAFNPDDDDVRFSAKVWFSQMGNVLAAKMPKQASKEQVRNILKAGGVKEDEIKWTGILDYLDAQKEPIQKEALLAWLETNNVQIQEVVKKDLGQLDFPEPMPIAEFTEGWIEGNRAHYHREFPEAVISTLRGERTEGFMLRIPADLARSHNPVNNFYHSFNEASERAYEILVASPAREAAARREASVDPDLKTEYDGYTLPGGTDYTELLLTLPPKSPTRTRKAYQLRDVTGAPYAQGNEDSARRWREEGKEVFEIEEFYEAENPGVFVAPHFGGKPNILAHARFKTRKDGNGQSVLFLEEVQSDWHEQGREKGYKRSEEEVTREIARISLEIDKLPRSEGLAEDSPEYRRLFQERRDLQDNLYKDVPDAPFKKTWPELVLKRMLRWAAEHNYDRLAWTTGAQQNERYGLAKHGVSISYYANEDDTYNVRIDNENGGAVYTNNNASVQELNGVIGRELTQKLVDGVGMPGVADFGRDSLRVKEISGVDLEVGGSGMKYFYDQMLPKFMEKYLKRFGTRVDALEVQTAGGPLTIQGRSTAEDGLGVPDKFETVHSIALTPEMKESVINQGQPLFSKKEEATFAPRTPAYPVSQPGKLDRIERILRDKNVDIRRVVEDIQEHFGPIPEGLNPVLAEEMYQKRDEQRARDFTNDELRPLTDLMKLNKVTVKQLDEYAHAYHVITDNLNARLQAINPDLVNSPNWDKLSGITDIEAHAILNAANRPVMDSLMRHVKDMVETTRELMVSYGLEAQQTIDDWRNQYQAYVPLRREGFDHEGYPTGKGRSVRGSTVKGRGGSGLAVENILANIAQARDQVVTRGEKMRPVIAFAGLMMQYPNPAIATLDKPATITYIDPATGLPMTVPGNLANYQVPTIRRYNPVTGQMQTYPDPVYKGRENVVNFRIKGVDYAIVFDEQNERAMEVAKAFKNLETPQLNGIMRAIAPYTRYLAAINTQYNPIFGIVNFVRDAQFAMLTLTSTPLAGKQATVLKNALGSLHGIYQDARNVRKGLQTTSQTGLLWRRFEHVGGPTGYRDLFFTSKERATEIERMLDPNSNLGLNPLSNFPQRLGKRMEDTWLFKWLSDYNLMMENAIRLGVFKTAIENGVSDLQAASYAKNITVNFNKKGQIGAQMGSLYAFFNANVQGSARIAETLFERTPTGFRISAAGKKIIVGGILVGVLQTFVLAMAGFDDDDPPEFVKQKNLIFPIPGTDKKYLMLPMPLGFNVLPNLGRLTAEVVTDAVMGRPSKPIEKMAAMIGTLYNTLSPTGGSGGLVQELMPTAVDPFAAIAMNKDWTGKAISKEDRSTLDPTPGHTRAHDTATFWAKGLAKAINWATGGTDFTPGVLSPTPDAVDYLITQASGGIGREISKGAQTVQSLATGEELPTHKIPLVGRFVGAATGSSSVRSKFYDLVRQSNIAYNEFEGRAKTRQDFGEYIKEHPEARFSKVAAQVQENVGVLQKQKQLMLKRGDSRDVIRIQEERITSLMARFNALVEKAQKPSSDSP